MSFIRPAILVGLHRLREVIAGAACILPGLWLVFAGGYVLPVIGLALLALGLGWMTLALRRLRFAQTGEVPGIVRVTEAQIAYMGPRVGGFVGLPELVEIRLLTLRGRRVWKLRPLEGPPLHIPVEAAGAEALFDAFATLPGIDMPALLAALVGTEPSDSRVVAINSVDRPIWARGAAQGIVAR